MPLDSLAMEESFGAKALALRFAAPIDFSANFPNSSAYRTGTTVAKLLLNIQQYTSRMQHPIASAKGNVNRCCNNIANCPTHCLSHSLPEYTCFICKKHWLCVEPHQYSTDLGTLGTESKPHLILSRFDTVVSVFHNCDKYKH